MHLKDGRSAGNGAYALVFDQMAAPVPEITDGSLYLTPSPLSYYDYPLLQTVADVGFQNFEQIFWLELENYISKDMEGRSSGLI
jgi:hypothetical protein